MRPETLIQILSRAEKLKSALRHCDTSEGRRESVAEHSWRASLMAMLLGSEFPDTDIDKVIRMIIIHDLGEAFTGDIPAFWKKKSDAEKETDIFFDWIASFSEPERSEWQALLKEMEALETKEAKLYKAIDKLEAVIQHDEADISTWIPLEYELQYTYGAENVRFSPYLMELKAEVDRMTTEKIRKAGGKLPSHETAGEQNAKE